MKLTDDAKSELLSCLRQRRELTTKKLCARFNVGRTTIWSLESELKRILESEQIVQFNSDAEVCE